MKMLIEESGGRVKVALLKNGELIDYTEEETERGQLKGNIYKGVVTRIEPSLQAAFVDLGEDRNGFIQLKDVHPRNYPPHLKPSERPPIQEVLKRRQPILVQVARDPVPGKGPDLTSHISLVGRYLVLMPEEEGVGGISRKIDTSEDRVRIREMVNGLAIPKGSSIIVRTVGKTSTKRELERDLARLVRLWDKIKQDFESKPAPSLLFSEEDAAFRALRDYLTPEVDEVVVSSEQVASRVKAYAQTIMPRTKITFTVHQKPTPLMVDAGVERQVLACLEPEVPLPSGGSLVIQTTAALVAVDVNSGKSTRLSGTEQTALSTNIEAAKELARQLRLRDLGGLIVVDFIDMEDQRHRAEVERQLKAAMKEDKARVRIGRISEFGMLEMSRQRLRRSLLSLRTSPCPRCGGKGRIVDPYGRATRVMELLEHVQDRREVTVEVDADTAVLLMNQYRAALAQLEATRGLRVRLALAPSPEPEPRLKEEKVRKEKEQEVAVEAASREEAPKTEQKADQEAPARTSRRRRRRRRPSVTSEQAAQAPGPAPVSQEPAPEQPKVRSLLKRLLKRSE